MLKKMCSKYIGDKEFYKRTLAIALPIIVQNGITNSVSLLDSMMIGQLGMEQVSGVSIINQLIYIYTECMYGIVVGAGIYTAQFFGQGNEEGVHQTMRFKLLATLTITCIAIFIFLFFGTDLISFYLSGEGSSKSVADTLMFSRQYLHIILLGLPAYSVTRSYATTLCECGHTVLPLKASMTALFINLVLNYILIQGCFGIPGLGVCGAALATVVSRYAELIIMIYQVHKKTSAYSFMKSLYHTMAVPKEFAIDIIKTGMPFLFNEMQWVIGEAIVTQCYSTRGLYIVAALSVSTTINELFTIIMEAFDDALLIILGQVIGAGEFEVARDTDNKLITFSAFCCSCSMVVMILFAPMFPKAHNIGREAQVIASHFIRIMAISIPFKAICYAISYTLDSGGKTIISFLYDSIFSWGMRIPMAFILSRFTVLSAINMCILMQLQFPIRCAVGFILLKRVDWPHGSVGQQELGGLK